MNQVPLEPKQDLLSVYHVQLVHFKPTPVHLVAIPAGQEKMSSKLRRGVHSLRPTPLLARLVRNMVTVAVGCSQVRSLATGLHVDYLLLYFWMGRMHRYMLAPRVFQHVWGG